MGKKVVKKPVVAAEVPSKAVAKQRSKKYAGYTLSEILEVCEASKKDECGVDEVLGDSAYAENIIRALVKEVMTLQAENRKLTAAPHTVLV